MVKICEVQLQDKVMGYLILAVIQEPEDGNLGIWWKLHLLVINSLN